VTTKELRALALLFLATAVSYPIGLATGSRWLLPALNMAPAYFVMVLRLHAGDRAGALRLMLFWAFALAVSGTVLFSVWPQDPGPQILNGAAYRDEMFRWIRTGAGSEGDLTLFLPQHLLHLLAFVALCLATGSVVSIFMGAVLMNYMSYYVASLARAGTPEWAVVFLGWQPWALVRVAAFCALGTVLAEPLLSRVWRYDYGGLKTARRVVAWSALGILADWTLKAVLAPSWGRWLRALLP
jgi:hypothetical protein